MTALRPRPSNGRFATIPVLAIATLLLGIMHAHAAPTPGQLCQASKNGAAAKYLKCLHGAYGKAVTSGVTDFTKCDLSFIDKWDAAEAKGAGACPDVTTAAQARSYVAERAALVASILSGDSGVSPACGDGVINQVGEQCDGSDFNGLDCTGLNYLGGTLSCDVGCRLDASACSPCPNGMVYEDGICWKLSGSNQSCTSACGSSGLDCNETAVQSVGSEGTDADCSAIMDLLEPTGAPWSATTYNISICGSPAVTSIGCVLQRGFSAVKRVEDLAPTSCDADNNGGCILGGVPERVCGCTPP